MWVITVALTFAALQKLIGVRQTRVYTWNPTNILSKHSGKTLKAAADRYCTSALRNLVCPLFGFYSFGGNSGS